MFVHWRNIDSIVAERPWNWWMCDGNQWSGSSFQPSNNVNVSVKSVCGALGATEISFVCATIFFAAAIQTAESKIVSSTFGQKAWRTLFFLWCDFVKRSSKWNVFNFPPNDNRCFTLTVNGTRDAQNRFYTASKYAANIDESTKFIQFLLSTTPLYASLTDIEIDRILLRL